MIEPPGLRRQAGQFAKWRVQQYDRAARQSRTPGMTMESQRILVHHLIDYAGLFPPAALAMPQAVQRYAAYRNGAHAWALGRFVVPAARLPEFAAVAASLPIDGVPWQISALGGTDLATDCALINAFNRQHASRAAVDVIEWNVATPDQIDRALQTVPATLTPYVELSLDDQLDAHIATLARRGARAKVRTGGVTVDAFPPPAALTRFIARCVAAGVPFKATAGLHHPIRSTYRLTYAPDSPSATMYGFLNVFLAAAFAHAGRPDLIEPIMLETDRAAFRFDQFGVAWRDERVSNAQLATTRQHCAIAFGSCSFEEPINEFFEV